MTNQPAEAHFSVNATAVKLPPFWTHQAAFWFRQAEIQFALDGITSDTTKFYHVFASIDQKAPHHERHLGTSTPTTFQRRYIARFGLFGFDEFRFVLRRPRRRRRRRCCRCRRRRTAAPQASHAARRTGPVVAISISFSTQIVSFSSV